MFIYIRYYFVWPGNRKLRLRVVVVVGATLRLELRVPLVIRNGIEDFPFGMRDFPLE